MLCRFVSLVKKVLEQTLGPGGQGAWGPGAWGPGGFGGMGVLEVKFDTVFKNRLCKNQNNKTNYVKALLNKQLYTKIIVLS